MIGEITGQSVEKNRDGENNVRMLQVTIYTDDNAESVQLARPSGEDSNPPNGTRILNISVGNAYKVGFVIDDGIEPTSEDGEKEFYSIVNKAKGATLKLDKNSKIIMNDGAKDAARKTDTTKLTMSGIDIQALAAALLTTGAFTPTGSPPAPASSPVTFNDGEITSGTNEVQLP